MRAYFALPRRTAVLAAVFGTILFGACNKQKKDSSPSAPNPAPAPVVQQNPTPQPPVQTKLPKPVVRLEAWKLFDMGKEGEEKYKGKVVEIRGLVDVPATKRPGLGETSTLIVQAQKGEPPYAVATFGPDSVELLDRNDFKPPSVTVHGIYRGRDENGTVLLDNAKVMSLTYHNKYQDFRREDPSRPRPGAGKKPKAPVAISAQQLAQGLQDDFGATYGRYFGVPILIDGVVSNLAKDKGAITMIQFAPPVTDKKTNKPVDLIVFCGLKDKIPEGSPAAADVAVGKHVHLIGSLSAAGNGQATLYSCVVQKQEPKK